MRNGVFIKLKMWSGMYKFLSTEIEVSWISERN